MQTIRQNQKLKQLTEEIDSGINNAKTNEDLLKTINAIRNYPYKLDYDYNLNIILTTFGAILFAVPFMPISPNDINSAVLVSIVGSAIAIINVYMIIHRSFSLDRRESKINDLCSLFSNGISKNESDNLHIIESKFSDYYRGNYSRNLTTSLHGTHKEPESFYYEYYQLHYVDRVTRTVTYTDSQGRTKTRTEETFYHYDRFSLVVPATPETDGIRNIVVASAPLKGMEKDVPWETTLNDFNRKFSLSGESEVSCVKFARPPVILHFLEIGKYFHDANIEYSSDGSLCVSFSNNNLLSYTAPSADIRETEDYYLQISAGIALPKLQLALRLVGRLLDLHRVH